ncbi:hypothetical protein OIU85_007341 [Salix viminalis]|uniref:X8 domain-containing protein n=1 Tax=Salix viminalis TaxID=40686 RepID=A0A9Q0SN84_SALVM|nr:hypothetical protein OIU85_007341 [Salix viminalis]
MENLLPNKLFFIFFGGAMFLAAAVVVEGNWCVARSDASTQALQTSLDYACGSGADCTPLQPNNGLCFLPNTIQAHSSYAFNSYFQRKGMAPGSCDFSGTATVAKTDPSYGSCVYPIFSKVCVRDLNLMNNLSLALFIGKKEDFL